MCQNNVLKMAASVGSFYQFGCNKVSIKHKNNKKMHLILLHFYAQPQWFIYLIYFTSVFSYIYCGVQIIVFLLFILDLYVLGYDISMSKEHLMRTNIYLS